MNTPWAEVIENDLKTKPASYAADFLRDTLADDKPGTLIVAMQHISRAHGGIDDLGLSSEEKAQIASTMGPSMSAYPLLQAA
jgi:hypothetical protein